MAKSSVKYKSLGQAVALDLKLKKLSAAGFAEAKQRVGDTLRSLIAEEFDTATDPRGQHWAPRVPPTGAWPLMQLSGNMRDSFMIDSEGPRLTIANTAKSEAGRPYPLFHQRGTVRMVARKIVPDKYISPKWRAALRRAVALALEQLK